MITESPREFLSVTWPFIVELSNVLTETMQSGATLVVIYWLVTRRRAELPPDVREP